MSKKGWCVGLGQKDVAWAWGGTVWNILTGGGTEKSGGEAKIFKRGGGKLG